MVEPVVFDLICPNIKEGFAPDVSLVSSICLSIDNPSFKTKRFQSYLDNYAENGLRVKRKKKITPEILEHYEKIRNRRLLKKIK